MEQDEIFDFKMTQEQADAYAARVEQLLSSRQDSSTLLSSFDLIAGASLIFFASGNVKYMPARWVLAGIREGLLPDGLLEQAMSLDRKLSDAREALEPIEDFAESIQDILDGFGEIHAAFTESVKKLKSAQRVALEAQASKTRS